MRASQICLAFCSAICLCGFVGCGDVLRIKKGEFAQPPGIPFYLKTAGCKQQTVWLQPVYALTLKATFTPTDKKEKTTTQVSSAVLSLGDYNQGPVTSLRALLSKAGGESTTPEDADTAMQLWNDHIRSKQYNPFPFDESKLAQTDSAEFRATVKVENVSTPEAFVDYSTPYYYNSRKPLSGSGQASFKLGTDGTLTEGSSQIEDKTLQAFLDLLPVKDVLSKFATTGATFAIDGGRGPGSLKLELTTDTKIYKHTHYKIDSSQKPPCSAPAGDLTTGYSLLLEEVSEPKKKEDDNSIKVSGSIQMPKKSDEKDKSK